MLHYESSSFARWQSKFAAAAGSEVHADVIAAARFTHPISDASARNPEDTAATSTSAPADDNDCECSREAPRRRHFFASSMVAAKAVVDAEALHGAAPDRAEKVAAAHAAARSLWEGWKRQPENLPALGPSEKHRVLRERGITLITAIAGGGRAVL